MNPMRILANVCSLDDEIGRYATNHLFIDNGSVFATDTRLAVRVKDGKLPSGQFLVPAKVWELACELNDLDIHFANGKVCFETAVQNVPVKAAVDAGEGKFPPVKQIMDEYEGKKPVFQISFGARYLKKVAEIAIAMTEDEYSDEILFGFHGNGKAAYVQLARNESVDMIIQPMSVPSNTDMDRFKDNAKIVEERDEYKRLYEEAKEALKSVRECVNEAIEDLQPEAEETKGGAS